jgi:hypothetical protein
LLGVNGIAALYQLITNVILQAIHYFFYAVAINQCVLSISFVSHRLYFMPCSTMSAFLPGSTKLTGVCFSPSEIGIIKHRITGLNNLG